MNENSVEAEFGAALYFDKFFDVFRSFYETGFLRADKHCRLITQVINVKNDCVRVCVFATPSTHGLIDISIEDYEEMITSCEKLDLDEMLQAA
jgi:hypothetical protein